MVSARWGSKETTGVLSDMWVRRRWLDVACSGVGGRLSGDNAGGGNGSGFRQEIKMRVREYGKNHVKV